MTYLLLSAGDVEYLHDLVLNPGELEGRARDKSLEGALHRVDTRLQYGMVEDIFDLAAAYAEAVARGHCFNDGNKRTAYRVMTIILQLNGVTLTYGTEEVGDLIIQLAQGKIDETDLATWLRSRVT